jgi:hypothetical protein
MTAAKDLYRIITGATIWTLTSSDEEVEYGSGTAGALELYEPVPMGRGGVTIKNELTKANLEINIPLSHDLAILLLGTWLEVITTVTVFRSKPSGTAVIWKGRLTSAKPGDKDVKLTFESVYTSMRRPGLRARFQKSCRHPLYGRGCYLDPEDFAVAATVTDIQGRSIFCPEAALQASGFYTGGMVKAADGTLTYITEHSGNQLELNRVSGSLAIEFSESGPGNSVTIYPGCDHSYATCDTKFNNDDNYGGFDYIPTKNPMGGSSIV